jgi:hypothetical protein
VIFEQILNVAEGVQTAVVVVGLPRNEKLIGDDVLEGLLFVFATLEFQFQESE